MYMRLSGTSIENLKFYVLLDFCGDGPCKK